MEMRLEMWTALMLFLCAVLTEARPGGSGSKTSPQGKWSWLPGLGARPDELLDRGSKLQHLGSMLRRLENLVDDPAVKIADHSRLEWPSDYQQRNDFNSWETSQGGGGGLHDVFGSPGKRRWWQKTCDINRITASTLIEFLRTGRLCGRRVTSLRFGLSGR